MDIPPSLKGIKPYLQHAQQTGKFDPVIAYYCRCYAVQLGVDLNKKNPADENKIVLLSIIDKLEKEKAELQDKLSQPNYKQEYVETFAEKVFSQADEEDRAGLSNKVTARNFYAASIFITILKQFSEDNKLSPEWEKKCKYAKWKAADITNCIREGRPIIPGSGAVSDEELFGGAGEDGAEEGAPRSSPALSGGEAPPSNAGLSLFPAVPTHVEMTMPPSPSFPSVSSPPSAGGFPSFPSTPMDTSPAHSSYPSWPAAPQATQPPQYQQPSPFQPQQPQQPPPFQYQPPQQPPQQQNQQLPQYPPPQPKSQPQPQPQPTPTKPPQPHVVMAPVLNYDNRGVTPEKLAQATKFAKYAVSSLQFDDVGAAVENLRAALRELGQN